MFVLGDVGGIVNVEEGVVADLSVDRQRGDQEQDADPNVERPDHGWKRTGGDVICSFCEMPLPFRHLNEYKGCALCGFVKRGLVAVPKTSNDRLGREDGYP
jgi:hypothetical protein